LLGRENEQIEEIIRTIRDRRRELRLPIGKIQMARLDRDRLLHLPAWTDDYSDLFRLLKKRRTRSAVTR